MPLTMDDTRQVANHVFWAGDWVDGPENIGYTHGTVLKGRAAAELLLASL